jgi:hypothetical protein
MIGGQVWLEIILICHALGWELSSSITQGGKPLACHPNEPRQESGEKLRRVV